MTIAVLIISAVCLVSYGLDWLPFQNGSVLMFARTAAPWTLAALCLGLAVRLAMS